MIPKIEASAAFRDGGLIDITFDEAYPPFTYTGNSFANSRSGPAQRRHLDRRRLGRRDAVRPRRAPRADRAEHAARHRTRTATSSSPGPASTRTWTGPSNCVEQTVPRQPAGTCILGGGSHVPGAQTDAGATAAAGSSTIADNAIVATDPGRSVTGHRHSARRLRGRGHRHADPRDRAETGRRLRGHRLVHPRRLRRPSAADDRPGQRRRARSTHARERSALRRHPCDHRRRRHRQRADQPLHPAAHRQHDLLQPLQLAAHDRGPIRGRAAPPAAWMERVTSATRPSAGSRRSAGMSSTPAGAAAVGSTAAIPTGCRPPRAAPLSFAAQRPPAGGGPGRHGLGHAPARARAAPPPSARPCRGTPVPDSAGQPVHVRRHVHARVRRDPDQPGGVHARRRARSRTPSPRHGHRAVAHHPSGCCRARPCR